MAVSLDRSLESPSFNSWRINVRSAIEEVSEELPGSLFFQKAYGGDFIRTYTAVLHNSITRLATGSLCVFPKQGETLKLYQLFPLRDLGVAVALPPSPPPPELQEPASVVEARCSGDAADTSSRALLYSCGCGQLQVAEAVEAGAPFVCSQPVALFEEAGGVTVPFVISAAAHFSGGIRALVWRTVDRKGALPAHVGVYTLDLSTSHAPGGLQLSVLRKRMLARSALRPQVATIDPETGSVVLGVDPGEGLDGMRWGDSTAAGDEGEGGKTAENGGDTTAPDLASQPRSLVAAAEEMQELQKELEEKPAPDPHVDLFGEDEDGEASTSAANLDLLLFSEEDGGGLSSKPSARIQCRPYKLLSTASDGTLGLTADVDCALLTLQRGGGGGSPPLSLHHVASIPALAYIVEGKTQRKFVLLGSLGCRVAAVIVESHKYAFVYYALQQQNDKNGELQVIELGFQPGSPGVQGAALVEEGTSVKLCVVSIDTVKSWTLC